MTETKHVTGKFLQSPSLGDLFVNANRHTEFVPRYKVTKVNRRSVHLEGIDRDLNFIVRINSKAVLAVFKKAEEPTK